MKPETRKDEIIKTAAKLFKEKGYSAVTMRDIAAAMGMKAASLYNHINSKQEILKEIIISLAEEFTNEMELIKESNNSCIEKLKQIVELHITITSQNTFGMASLNSDWMHLEEQLDYYLKLRINYEENFRSVLSSGILNKEISNKNTEVILFSMLSTLRSLYIWIPSKEDINIKKLSEQLSDILINGINK
ncbi:TetR/AcrR family transcriptional regulator [Xanthomarina sp. GH4-25]|uniref:TetR/AcrR family transcriptional regulator n=1 Tax=Xanthomarina sp. GH4-25 TaxID=3349335 RepID=UPI000D67971F|nr:TetR/AcrR family transcriptional regulator [Flavobacteriaceae bacterium LYZ1037]